MDAGFGPNVVLYAMADAHSSEESSSAAGSAGAVCTRKKRPCTATKASVGRL
jgi:hypothetical protein